MIFPQFLVALSVAYLITLLNTVNAATFELQRIEYMPNCENKMGEIDHLVVEHMPNGLTVVSFEGKVFEPVSPEIMSICFLKKIDGKYTNETEGNICNYSFNFCEAMAGRNPDPATKRVIAAIKFFAPNMVHECPYQKLYAINNQTFDSHAFTVAWPPAEYMMETSLLMKDQVVFYFHVFFQVVAKAV